MNVDRPKLSLGDLLVLLSLTETWEAKLPSFTSPDGYLDYYAAMSYLIKNIEELEDTFPLDGFDHPYSYSPLYDERQSPTYCDQKCCDTYELTCFRIFTEKCFSKKVELYCVSACRQLAIHYAKSMVPKLLSLATVSQLRHFPSLFHTDHLYRALNFIFFVTTKKSDNRESENALFQKKLKGNLSVLMKQDESFAKQLLQHSIHDLSRSVKPVLLNFRMLTYSRDCSVLCYSLYPHIPLFFHILETISSQAPELLIQSETYWTSMLILKVTFSLDLNEF
jgi:hypothetical protein